VITGVGRELTDSLIAVIVAVPTPTAVTVVVPFVELAGLIVSTDVLLESQLTVRPVSVLLSASLSVAVSTCVPPTTIGVVGAESVTVATEASATVMDDVPVFVSLVAVMVVPPAPTAVTRPFPSTVAAAGLLEVHATTRPMSRLLAVSRSVAVSCCVGVIPSTRLAVAGVTVTVLTGASVTLIEDAPVFVSLVAVMIVPPAPAAVTRPFKSTVAAEGLLELHVTTRPVSTLPAASRSVAVSCCVGVTPTTRLAEDGVTVTVLTGASVTVIEDVPVFVSLVAVIVAPPAATAVTRPFPSTVAAAGLLDVHVTNRPVSTKPLASLVTAVSCCVGVTPSTRLAEGGLTVTIATGTGLTVITGVVALGADSLVALIVAVPSSIAVTVTVAPLDVLTELATLTVSTAVLLECQLTVRPVRALLLASFGVAISTWVPPTTIGVVGAERVTVLTGASVTVIEDVPVFASLVAVIVAGPPAATPVTSPVALTVATAPLLELHVTVRPVSTLPLLSVSVAVICCVGVIPRTKLADRGFTVTVATGTGSTVIVGVAVEITDSLVAVIVAVPTPVAVTVVVPLVELAGLTVSTAVLLETQLTVRPESRPPFTSFVTAVTACVPPTTIGVVGAERVTVTTGASTTVIKDAPVFVSPVAVIVTGPPAATPVTRPFASTVAVAVLLELHVTMRSVSTLLLASRKVAVSCCVPPTTTLAGVGVTVTVATGIGVTVITTLPVFPPADATIVVEPGLTAASRPVELIDAIVASELDQVTTRFERTCPSPAVSVAVNCSDSPTTRDEAPFTISFSAGPLIVIAATASGVRMA